MPDVAPPLIDLGLGDLPKIWREAQMHSARQQALAPYGGDIGLAQLFMQNQRDQRDFAARRGDVGFQQGITERQTKLAEQSAADQAKGFDYREIDHNGEKVLVKINKATGEISKPDISGVSAAPTNPFAMGGKPTEAQNKDSGYADRMFRAEGVLRDPKVEEAAVSFKENLMGKAPGFVANYLTGPDFQKFDQAKRDFVNAVLRRESGAAISQSEFDNANKQYFPQPGDTKERIAEKRRNRQDTIAGIAGSGGPTYKPPASFGPDGELVPSGAPPRGQARPADPNAWRSKEVVTAARANPQAAIAEAQQAIQRGADPNAVAQRLKQLGIDPSALTRNTFASPEQRQ